MKRILKDQNGNIFSAEIVSSIPSGFIDITDDLVENPDVDGVATEHLEAIDTPAVPEKWTRSGFSDSSSQPFFAVNTWIKNGEPDLTSAPPDVTYTLQLASSLDARWSHTPVVPEFWSRVGFVDKLLQPIFSVDTWIKDGVSDVVVDPLDETYTLMLTGSPDVRWAYNPTVPEFWSRAGFADVLSQPIFEVDTWTKDGSPDLIVQPVDESYTLKLSGETDTRWTHVPMVPAYKTLYKKASWVAHDKNTRITQAYNQMNIDVLAQMAVVFGTTRTDSASAYNETWKEMATSPSDWSTANLKATFAVAGFQINDLLDTALKVSDFANAKLAEAKAYAIWRMQRIEQFRVERDLILAE